MSSEVWEYTIGGYQVLDKYLKSHKGEEIDYEHFQKIIAILHKSLEIEKEISQIDTGVWNEQYKKILKMIALIAKILQRIFVTLLRDKRGIKVE